MSNVLGEYVINNEDAKVIILKNITIKILDNDYTFYKGNIYDMHGYYYIVENDEIELYYTIKIQDNVPISISGRYTSQLCYICIDDWSSEGEKCLIGLMSEPYKDTKLASILDVEEEINEDCISEETPHKDRQMYAWNGENGGIIVVKEGAYIWSEENNRYVELNKEMS
ncbi:hypothetical protein OW763_06935 [Clostridium aestuarii]|uniref:Uncharacterized protein n=1 Tax=Clostridium aestuarii TaxID=338193 RepID=A0ABT4CYM3_9CLOT|nr:hypothetical protein [Clostridium aestuarii]MCY6484086.1 hypothetical protein [Clostridium aestuarii]